MKSRARVLVVDDEPLMRRLVRTILAREGYAITQATGTPDALQKLQKSRFDIVITDIVMPDSDGFELLQAVKRDYPTTCVIVMTGFGDVATPDQARALGADEYITKPFNEREIAVIVERVCWRRMVANRLIASHPRIDASAVVAAGAMADTPVTS